MKTQINKNLAFGAIISTSLRGQVQKATFGERQALRVHKQLDLITKKGHDNLILCAKEIEGQTTILARLKCSKSVFMKLRKFSPKDLSMQTFFERLNLDELEAVLKDAIDKKNKKIPNENSKILYKI